MPLEKGGFDGPNTDEEIIAKEKKEALERLANAPPATVTADSTDTGVLLPKPWLMFNALVSPN